MKESIQLINLHKTFEKNTINENHVLKGIDLELASGDFVSIIGGNGAGKSTLLNSIAGSYSLDQGQILIKGEDVTRWPVHKRASKIGYVFQDPKLGTAVRLTIQENLALARKRGLKRQLVRGVTEDLQEEMKSRLTKLNLGLEERLNTEVAYLSGGQRQALTLLMATYQKPDLLLLDEHTAALDPATSQMVMTITDQLIRDYQLTALMITHNMADAIKYGNRLVMLDRGKVVLDLNQEQKAQLTVVELMQKFQDVTGNQIVTDQMLL
ncbi:ABC transporter ATP-binding protein [Vaginisenegalia massiliensis]|uniref:ABC transporter ATP-binding protein n=1 Tax=Vaginisenegalia massiliensis TaxID=2058294 RepID=UPI000F5258F5|nr:ATP-binding cassette domain-containing protein [Vaginisenegalia massiliensis]